MSLCFLILASCFVVAAESLAWHALSSSGAAARTVRLASSISREDLGKAVAAHPFEVDNKFALLDDLVAINGQVCQGYGRGSKRLGVPTANLPHFNDLILEHGLQSKVFFGWGVLLPEGRNSETFDRNSADGAAVDIFPLVANCGKSPTFVGQENSINIIEVHLMNPRNNPFGEKNGTNTKSATAVEGSSNKYSNIFDDFYGKRLRIVLVGSMRGEKKFGSFDHLIKQINFDIKMGLFIHTNTINSSIDGRVGDEVILSNNDRILDEELMVINYKKLSSTKYNFIDNYLSCIDDAYFLAKHSARIVVSADKNVFAMIENGISN